MVITNFVGGVLLIFNNYTGDVLNFGLALERARSLGYSVSIPYLGLENIIPNNVLQTLDQKSQLTKHKLKTCFNILRLHKKTFNFQQTDKKMVVKFFIKIINIIVTVMEKKR